MGFVCRIRLGNRRGGLCHHRSRGDLGYQHIDHDSRRRRERHFLDPQTALAQLEKGHRVLAGARDLDRLDQALARRELCGLRTGVESDHQIAAVLLDLIADERVELEHDSRVVRVLSDTHVHDFCRPSGERGP